MFGNPVILSVAALSALASSSCTPAPVSDPPALASAYVCVAATGDITIDGRLDERAWQDAEVIGTFYPFTPATDPALSPTRARMLWTPTHLYVGIECDDNDIWSYSDKDDGELWNGDVAELFIRTGTGDKSFHEFVVAPSGALFDALHASHGGGGYRRFAAWSSGAQVKVTVNGTDGDWRDDDHGYVVEMAIPLAAITGGQPVSTPDAWTFGVFRYNYSKSFDEAQLLMSIPEAPRWGFHYYPGYRPLLFEAKK